MNQFCENQEDRLAWAQLHGLRLPVSRVDEIQSKGGPQLFLSQDPEDLYQYLCGVRSRRSGQRLPSAKEWLSRQKRLSQFVANGGYIVGGQNRSELDKLAATTWAPLCLYGRGNPGLLRERPQIAIVGTRQPTSSGIDVAYGLGRTLGGEGCVVVSGGARGIDQAAHQGALGSGGRSIFVLGQPISSGRDERGGRIKNLVETHPERSWLTVTPHGPATPMSRSLFISRNRVLAAMVDAVVVVQGFEKSGTLYTAQIARRLGVPLWAIPGPQTAEWAKVPNQLIENGWAQPWRGVCAIMTGALERAGNRSAAHATPAMGPADRQPRRSADKARSFAGEQATISQKEAIEDHLKSVLSFLQNKGGRIGLDELVENLQIPAQTVMQYTLELELKGYISQSGGAIQMRPS
jgi:DNA processing protein